MALTDAELEALLGDLESDRVERKRVGIGTERLCQAICAFANDLPGHRAPGVLFLGADDDGTPSKEPITDNLLLKLAGFRDRGDILPLPEMVVRKVRLKGADVAVVEVQPSRTPPVRYQGVTWVRVGPRRARATVNEERQLDERRRAQDLPFDTRPVPGSSLADLDLLLFERLYLPSAVAPEVIEENGRSRTEQLASLRLADLDGTPTAAGLIVLGTTPTSFIPGAYVQFLRVDGTSLADPVVDEKRLEGPLVDVLRQLDELIDVNSSTHLDLAATVERRSSDQPPAALRQLIRNAVHHRSYEATNAPARFTWYRDRVEITSPGGPFGNVTPENFGTPGVTDYRNPTLSDAMRALGYVQRFGAGLVIARQALRANGNPGLEFDVDSGYVAVTVRSAL